MRHKLFNGKNEMLVFPNAKVNLGLYVTEKREDGYHNIESVFLPIGLQDSLDIMTTMSNSFEMELLGIEISGDVKDNICAKAWQLLHKEYGIGGVKCILLKNIPTGAGLGGGSADGAFMLKALNDIFKLQLSISKLEELAAQLGSDCPFFIENKPKFVHGRGEYLETIDLNLKGHFITIVNPGIHVSTPQAYSLIKPETAPINLRTLSSSSVKQWKNLVNNQFEKPIAELHPAIYLIKEKLYESGAIYAAMSGSGSSVYGIFSERKDMSQTFGKYFCRTVDFL